MNVQTSLPLGASTLGYLHRATIEETLTSLTDAGYSDIELGVAPPQLFPPTMSTFERLALVRHMRSLGQRVTSVNPIELNLISTNPEMAELSYRQLLACLQFSHDVASPVLVFGGGRRFPLVPCTLEDAHAILDKQLSRLLPIAEELGVTMALENVPFGFLQTAAEVCDVVDNFAHDSLGMTYDCGNAIGFEDPAEGVRRAGSRLKIIHVNGSWHDKWAHTDVGQGDVDFATFAAAIKSVGFTGPSIYELADGEDPQSRLIGDQPRLESWGWRATPTA